MKATWGAAAGEAWGGGRSNVIVDLAIRLLGLDVCADTGGQRGVGRGWQLPCRLACGGTCDCGHEYKPQCVPPADVPRAACACAPAVVGSPMLRGISGGQKKRVTTGEGRQGGRGAGRPGARLSGWVSAGLARCAREPVHRTPSLAPSSCSSPTPAR